MSLKITLFGPPRIELHGLSLDFKQRKPVTLLAYLAVTGQAHTRDALAAFFWPDYAQARTYLRNILSVLRQALNGSETTWLYTDRDTVMLRLDETCTVDVAAFRRLVTACQEHDCGRDEARIACLSSLEKAAALYTDDFLAGFDLRNSPPFDEWSFFQREQLRGQLAFALETLVDYHTQASSYALAISFAQRWLALDPLHEPAHRSLMELYMQMGQRAAALRQYEACLRILAEEIDATPAPETAALYQMIRRRQSSSSSVATASVATASVYALPTETSSEHVKNRSSVLVAVPESQPPHSPTPPLKAVPSHNLPHRLTPLIGRTEEIESACSLLRTAQIRLLTITGAGGVGKTSLSIEVARHLLDDFRDGTYFVSLASVRETTMIPSALAQILEVQESPNRPLVETIIQTLHPKQLLLVLDNFEHLVSAASIVTELLQACPQLKVLVTSREVLHLQGEYEVVVPPLRLPADQTSASAVVLTEFSAIDLFCQRAVAAHQTFALDDQNALEVVQLCQRLDGLPLALELAAAQLKYHSLKTLLLRFGEDEIIGNESSLNLLQSKKRGVPVRHLSMRDAIGWSYGLLTPDEQTLFRRLSIFVGGWTLEAASEICFDGVSLEPSVGLNSLIDKQLIQRIANTDFLRYTMLETLREFGLEQLMNSDDIEYIREQCADYFANFIQNSVQGLRSDESVRVYNALLQEYPNLRMVIRWALSTHNIPLTLCLCSHLLQFWNLARRNNTQSILEEALEVIEDAAPSKEYVHILLGAGFYSYGQGKMTVAHDLMQRGLAMDDEIGNCGDAAWTSMARGILAWIMFYQGDYAQAKAYHKDELKNAQDANNKWATAMCLVNMGNMATELGEYERAAPLIEEALVLHQQVGQTWAIAKTLADQAELYVRLGRYEQAKEILFRSLEMGEAIEHCNLISRVKRTQGHCALKTRDYTRASTLLTEALKIGYDDGDPHQVVYALELLAQLAQASEEWARLLFITCVTENMRKKYDLLAPPMARTIHKQMITQARTHLEQRTANEIWTQAAEMTLDEAVSDILEIKYNSARDSLPS
ncbi:MAG: BTAD domain-containing putative transcriptional regulator [Chloroflexota bacterium]